MEKDPKDRTSSWSPKVVMKKENKCMKKGHNRIEKTQRARIVASIPEAEAWAGITLKSISSRFLHSATVSRDVCEW